MSKIKQSLLNAIANVIKSQLPTTLFSLDVTGTAFFMDSVD